MKSLGLFPWQTPLAMVPAVEHDVIEFCPDMMGDRAYGNLA